MTNSTLELLQNHRSIRRFKDCSLPEGLLEQLVSSGQRASTSSNLQAYSVVHVSEPSRKAELAKLCGDQIQIHQSAAFLVFCADLHRDRLACIMHGSEKFDGDYVEALLIATVDTALLMQNVALAAESVGLGICMIGAIRNFPKSVGRFLELPPFVYAIAGFCLGYPAQDSKCKPRLPIGAVLHRERYMENKDMRKNMENYDREILEFYESQEMHKSDARWTVVTSERAGQFHDRAELGVFLKEQGFNMK